MRISIIRSLSRATSLRLWNRLPEGLLGRSSFESWHRLGHRVQSLVLRLTEEQNSKCFFCSNRTGLFIDHQHPPGIKEKPSAYNIRGLLCPRCNSHISYIEQEEVLGFSREVCQDSNSVFLLANCQ